MFDETLNICSINGWGSRYNPKISANPKLKEKGGNLSSTCLPFHSPLNSSFVSYIQNVHTAYQMLQFRLPCSCLVLLYFVICSYVIHDLSLNNTPVIWKPRGIAGTFRLANPCKNPHCDDIQFVKPRPFSPAVCNVYIAMPFFPI